MKQIFEDGSYVEVKPSPTGKVFITIAAKQADNPLESVINSVEITQEEFISLVSDIHQIKEQPIIIDGYAAPSNKSKPAKKKRTTKKKTSKKKKSPRKKKSTIKKPTVEK